MFPTPAGWRGAPSGEGGRVPGFSAVDDSVDPEQLLQLLDEIAVAEWGIKQYTLAAHVLRRPTGPVLDLGCGAGHDLALFASAGITIVGVDASTVMVHAARLRTSGLRASVVQASGERLPFPAAAFSGCRIERLLVHVDDPGLLLAEAIRCVRAGALLTVFEPDWSSLTVRSDVLAEDASWIASVRSPDVGARLPRLLEALRCDLDDRVVEQSVWRSLATLEKVAGFPESVDRAVSAGRLERDKADAWIREQRARDARGQFHAELSKVLVVATKRAA
jgi:SAM-dependent methyltransferase